MVTARVGQPCAKVVVVIETSAAMPAARGKNARRGSFMAPSESRFAAQA